MTKSITKNKSEKIEVRVSKLDKELIREKAGKAGMSMSSYILHKLLN